jgi:hypothetical protein
MGSNGEGGNIFREKFGYTLLMSKQNRDRIGFDCGL